MKKILLLLVLLAVCQPVFAQEGFPPSGPVVSVHYSLYLYGAGHSLTKQMKAEGFGEDAVGGGFFGSNEYPLKEDEVFQLGLQFPVGSKYRVKGLVLYSKSDVTGYAFNYEYLTVSTVVLSAAAIGYVPLPTSMFRIGAGPAFHLAKGTVLYGDAEREKKNFSKLGFVMEGGIQFPEKSRFFADLQVQYIYTGKGDLGTHTLSYTDIEGKTVSKRVDFSDTPFSNVALSLGAGFRFRKE